VGSDGRFGLFSKDVSASFDAVTVKTNDPSVPDVAAQNLLAASAPVTTSLAPVTLTAAELTGVLGAAITYWAGAGTLDAAAVAGLEELSVTIADLPGLLLGRAEDRTITIDANAAGWSWFVDTTPQESSEYAWLDEDSVLAAGAGSEADGRIDLLTVVIHEIGHLLGLEHCDGVMAETLAAGVRVLPVAAEPEAADVRSEAAGVVPSSPPVSIEAVEALAKGSGVPEATLPLPGQDGSGWHWRAPVVSNAMSSAGSRLSVDALLGIDPALAITYLTERDKARKVLIEWTDALRERVFDELAGTFKDLPVPAATQASDRAGERGPGEWIFASSEAQGRPDRDPEGGPRIDWGLMR
jgi:hypothetical protein